MARHFDDRKSEPMNCRCGQAAEVRVVAAPGMRHVYNVQCRGRENDCWRGPSIRGRDDAIAVWDEMMRQLQTKQLLDEFQAEKVRLDMILIDLGERNEP